MSTITAQHIIESANRPINKHTLRNLVLADTHIVQATEWVWKSIQCRHGRIKNECDYLSCHKELCKRTNAPDECRHIYTNPRGSKK